MCTEEKSSSGRGNSQCQILTIENMPVVSMKQVADPGVGELLEVVGMQMVFKP